MLYDSIQEYQDEDLEIYFDITTGFRSLPMLGIVFLNYTLTLMPKAKIKNIFYGNYEAGSNQRNENLKAERPDIGNINAFLKGTPEGQAWAAANPVQAPILDLQPFEELLNWNAAARAFLQGGSTNLLKQQLQNDYPNLAKMLNEFSLAIMTCRGQELTRKLDLDKLKNEIENLDTQNVPPLTPLLGKISDKLAPFISKNTINGMHAVEWCIDNDMIQQGYTFLQETWVSLLIETTYRDQSAQEREDRRKSKVIRDAANFALQDPRFENIIKADLYRDYRAGQTYRRFELEDWAADMMEQIVLAWNIAYDYKKMTGSVGTPGRALRNDMAHCGFSDEAYRASDLSQQLQALYLKFKAVVTKFSLG